MRGLSLTQPFATLVAIGAKRIETRSWGTSYRGTVAIHAAKAFPAAAREAAFLDERFYRALRRAGALPEPLPSSPGGGLPRGAIVAICTLRDVRQITHGYGPVDARDCPPACDEDEHAFGDYTPGRFMWKLAAVRRLPEPIPCRGALGLWDVPEDVRALLPDLVKEGP